MGWGSGSMLAEDLWDAIKPHIPEGERQTVALVIIDLFEHNDCDTMDEAEALMRDADPQMELEGNEAEGWAYEVRSDPLRPRTEGSKFPKKKS